MLFFYLFPRYMLRLRLIFMEQGDTNFPWHEAISLWHS
jgi:hypothetical protein